MHRDLNLYNLIIRDDNLSSLVIVDIRFLNTCKNGNLFGICGSPGYIAPEILNN